MFFGVFLLTFIPLSHVTHTRIFVQTQSSSQLALFEPLSFLLCPSSHLHQPTRPWQPVAATRAVPFFVSSREECIQSSPRSHTFTIVVAIITIEPGFIVAQEKQKATHVRLDAAKNITVLRSWRRPSLVWDLSGLAVQCRDPL